MKTLSKAILAAGSAGAILFTVGAIDVEVRMSDNAARAFDLFGDGSSTESAPFWEDGSGQEPIVPIGVPASFADLAEQVSPGVVNISTEMVMDQQPMNPFEQYFHGPFPFGGPGPFGPSPHRGGTQGTGFVISPDGYIVTNNHVIEDVDEINVTFEDGSTLAAEVIGRDPKTDVALIRVTPDEPLFALPLGNSDAVRPGDPASSARPLWGRASGDRSPGATDDRPRSPPEGCERHPDGSHRPGRSAHRPWCWRRYRRSRSSPSPAAAARRPSRARRA